MWQSSVWQTAQEWVVANKRPLGIWGDSLTFLGGVLLAAEALGKKSERISIAIVKTTAKYFVQAEDKAGNKINPETTEEAWVNRWHRISQLGAIAMAAGFLVLLLCRVFAE
jgi:hypothetical protein